MKEVPYYSVPKLPSRSNVTRPLCCRWIGIIYHKTGLRVQTQGQQSLLAVAGAQQIEADANMGVEKALLVKGALSGSLNAAEDDSLHK
jgi:hypothetical protein